MACTLALGLVSYKANAQAANIGGHLSTAIPFGDLAEFSPFGFGGGLSFDYYFNDFVNIGLELEHLYLPIEDSDGEAFGITPILLTGAYHTDFGDAFDFYGGLGVGAFIASSTIEGTESATNFGFSPRVGVAFEIADELFLDLSLRYSLILDGEAEQTQNIGGQTVVTQPETSNTSYLGFNVGLLYTIFE